MGFLSGGFWNGGLCPGIHVGGVLSRDSCWGVLSRGLCPRTYYHGVKCYAQTHFELFDIDQLLSFSGFSYINKALAKVEAEMFSPANGDRPDVNNVLVVLSDGKQTIPPTGLTPTLDAAAKSLRDRGITVVSVAIGERDDENLKLIATTEDLIFKIGSYKEVYKLLYNISNAICNGKCFSSNFCLSETFLFQFLGCMTRMPEAIVTKLLYYYLCLYIMSM